MFAWIATEGLPGRAWDEGCPILIPRFDGTYFKRIEAARASGLTCAIALPYFVKDRISAVLVMFCGHAPHCSSALELWGADAAPRGVMTLVEGAYGVSPAFEATSRAVTFAKGVGLPGLSWESGAARFLDSLNSPDGPFVRAQQAADAGFVHGLGFPIDTIGAAHFAVTFLADAQMPIALRIERWAPDESGTRLMRIDAYSEAQGGRTQVDASLPIMPAAPEAGAVVDAWTTALPVIGDQPSAEPGPCAATAAGIGATALLAIPMLRAGAVTEILALYI